MWHTMSPGKLYHNCRSKCQNDQPDLRPDDPERWQYGRAYMKCYLDKKRTEKQQQQGNHRVYHQSLYGKQLPKKGRRSDDKQEHPEFHAPDSPEQDCKAQKRTEERQTIDRVW